MLALMIHLNSMCMQKYCDFLFSCSKNTGKSSVSKLNGSDGILRLFDRNKSILGYEKL